MLGKGDLECSSVDGGKRREGGTGLGFPSGESLAQAGGRGKAVEHRGTE